MARVDAELASIINTNVSALTLGTNLFVSPERPADDPYTDNLVPSKSCFVFMSTGGPAPTVYADGGSGNNLNEHSVQVIVRGGEDDLSDARDLADEVYTYTRKCIPTDAVGCLTTQSAPAYLGEDEIGRHRFSINYTIYKKE